LKTYHELPQRANLQEHQVYSAQACSGHTWAVGQSFSLTEGDSANQRRRGWV